MSLPEVGFMISRIEETFGKKDTPRQTIENACEVLRISKQPGCTLMDLVSEVYKQFFMPISSDKPASSSSSMKNE